MAALPTKEEKLNWTLGPGVAVVRDKTGADYALFTYIRDSYASADRKAAMVIGALFGIGTPGGVQYGFISLVDLRTGQIVWANQVIRPTGDLRTSGPAQETIDVMLTGLVEQAGPPSAAPRPRSIRDW
jgi:NAD(P)H-hydrate repair Nnr-like enzyme with NAD(P)H-hydrate epimerase domain